MSIERSQPRSMKRSLSAENVSDGISSPRKIQKCSSTENVSGSSRENEEILDTAETAIPAEEPTSLLVLNEHCLEHLVQYVPTIEQYHLMRSHSMLERVVRYTWSTQLTEAHYEKQDFANFTEEQFRDFMQAISPYIERLTLNYLPLRLFTQLNHCYFPRVHTFDCIDPYQLSRRDEDRYDESAIQAIKTNFPKLVSLKVKGFCVVFGMPLFGMYQLRSLTLNFL